MAPPSSTAWNSGWVSNDHALAHRYVTCASASSLCSWSGMLSVGWLRNAGQIPFDVFPEFAPPLVEIQTEGARHVDGRSRSRS